MKIQTLTVDWDSLRGVENAISRLRARQKELKTGMSVVVKMTKGKRFALCFSILESDISDLYSTLALDTKARYYVYAQCDTSRPLDVTKTLDAFAATQGLTYQPFYIGKGTSGRDSVASRNETHRKVLQRLSVLGKEPETVRLAINLTESAALQLEAKLMIDVFGLLTSGGYLTNLDEGHSRTARRSRYRDHLLTLHAHDYEKIKKELFGVPLQSVPYTR